MCVIVHNRKGSRKLTKPEFNSAWNRNPHGFGVMYVKDSIVQTKKSLEFEESYDIYNEAMDIADDGNVVSHFRFKTHGPVVIDNVHPFPCGLDSSGGTMQLVHNGVLGFTSKANPDWSDTKIFATALQRFPRDYHKMEEYAEMIEKQLSWDKILIMDSTGNVSYFGDKGIMIDEGIWASNSSPVVYEKKKSILPTQRTQYQVNGTTYTVGSFAKIPSPTHECDDCYFAKSKLYFDDFMIDELGIVREYIENDDDCVIQ